MLFLRTSELLLEGRLDVNILVYMIPFRRLLLKTVLRQVAKVSPAATLKCGVGNVVRACSNSVGGAGKRCKMPTIR